MQFFLTSYWILGRICIFFKYAISSLLWFFIQSTSTFTRSILPYWLRCIFCFTVTICFHFLLNGIQRFSFLAFWIPKTWLVVKAEIQTTKYWHLNEFKQPVVTSFFYTMCIHFSGNVNSVWIIITSFHKRAPIVCNKVSSL